MVLMVPATRLNSQAGSLTSPHLPALSSVLVLNSFTRVVFFPPSPTLKNFSPVFRSLNCKLPTSCFLPELDELNVG